MVGTTAIDEDTGLCYYPLSIEEKQFLRVIAEKHDASNCSDDFDFESLMPVLTAIYQHSTSKLGFKENDDQETENNLAVDAVDLGDVDVRDLVQHLILLIRSIYVQDLELGKIGISILDALMNHTWEAKIVLILGAFIMRYSEFSSGVLQRTLDHPVAQTWSILNKSPFPKTRQELSSSFTPLCNLVKSLLEVCALMIQFKKDRAQRDVQDLESKVTEVLHMVTYQTLKIVVTCSLYMESIKSETMYTTSDTVIEEQDCFLKELAHIHKYVSEFTSTVASREVLPAVTFDRENAEAVIIRCRRGKDFSLTIRNGQVVLALANHLDRQQHWILRDCHDVKDKYGKSSISIINKADGQAIQHCGRFNHVKLIPYDPNVIDRSILWTRRDSSGDGVYSVISPASDTDSNLDAYTGIVQDGTTLCVWPPNADSVSDNQQWNSAAAVVPFDRENAEAVIIRCRRGKDFSLTIRNGQVVLALANHLDRQQHWILRDCHDVKDKYGKSSISIINKADGQAIQHCGKYNHVKLIPYDPNVIDHSVLWSRRDSSGDGVYSVISPASDTDSNLDAYTGIVQDGTTLCVWPPNADSVSDNQQWNSAAAVVPFDRENAEAVIIRCRRGKDFSLTIRNGQVVLALADHLDRQQHWILRDCHDVKDKYGKSSISIINKADGQAIQHCGKYNHVKLIPYDPNVIDHSILWSRRDSSGDGVYSFISPASDTDSTLDAYTGVVQDGTTLCVWWPLNTDSVSDNQNQQWNFAAAVVTFV